MTSRRDAYRTWISTRLFTPDEGRFWSSRRVFVAGIVVAITFTLLNPFNAGVLELLLYSFPSAPVVFVGIYYLGFVEHETPVPDMERAPALLARLRKHSCAKEILSIEAQDHYVEVTTELGSELCLLRLTDAISETEPVEGMRIHRSAWVAKSAIKEIQTSGKLSEVLLVNGNALKVSQSRLKSLKQALYS